MDETRAPGKVVEEAVVEEEVAVEVKGAPRTWRNVEISQQVAHGMTPEVVEAILEGWKSVDKFAYILHDKDVKKDGSPVEPHYHIMIAFSSPVPTGNILARCEKFAPGVVKVQNLEKCKKWSSAVAYLTHENVPDSGKHIYNREEVVANFDISETINEALSGREKKNELLRRIDSGEVREYNITDYCSVVEYAKWEKDIKKAFEYYRIKIQKDGGNRKMECIYVQGESGSGKTTMAKNFCEERGLSYFVSSGSNDPLDGYKGQEVVILDDLRPSAFRLADLLKMLDNNTASSVPSRYANKVLYCRYIIITTTLDIDTFFKNVFAESPEAAKQLKRRCSRMVLVTKTEVQFGSYDKNTDGYDFFPPFPNPVALKFGSLSASEAKEKVVSSVADMAASFGVSSDTVASFVQEFGRDDSPLPFTPKKII